MRRSSRTRTGHPPCPDGALVFSAACEGTSMDTPQQQSVYLLGRSDHETARLQRQAQLYGPLTRRLLVEAGIGSGMRVLDVGSGAGDVALLVAEMVGPMGQVVGVDTNAHILN